MNNLVILLIIIVALASLSNNVNEETSLNHDQEKPKVLDEPLSIDDDEIPF